MNARIARIVLMLAASILPPGSADWGRAMAAEAGQAVDDGRPLRFAAGCLYAAVRASLAHPAGRFAATRSALAVMVIVPLAIFHLGCTVSCLRFLATGQDAYHAALMAGDDTHRRTALAYAASAPLFALLLPTLAAAHFRVAWTLMDWRPRPLLAALAVAALAACGMAIAILCVTADVTGIAAQFAAIALEIAMLVPLLAWNRRIEGRITT